jgi:hypothetical protein
VELAELGALIQAKGFKPEETNDDHPLARPPYLNNNVKEISQYEIFSFRKSVQKRLKRFPGKTNIINSLTYLDFEDYCSWKGRGLRDDLHLQISEGFLTSSWNKWLDAGEGNGCLEGVQVERLGCYLKEHDYQVFQDTQSRLENRTLLLSVLSKSATPQTEHELEFWKNTASIVLTKLYVFRQAAIEQTVSESITVIVSCLTSGQLGRKASRPEY